MRQGCVDATAGGAAEPFFADEQQPADIVERIALAAPMATHVLLGALADFGDDLIGKPDHVQSASTVTVASGSSSLAGVRYPHHRFKSHDPHPGPHLSSVFTRIAAEGTPRLAALANRLSHRLTTQPDHNNSSDE